MESINGNDGQDVAPEIRLLIDWVLRNGGAHNVQVKEDQNGVRGLYSSRSFNTPDGPKRSENEEPPFLVKIPSKLIVSPYHVQNQPFSADGQVRYAEIFAKDPQVFDPKFKYKVNNVVKSRIDNEYAEYFQLTFFLLSERLRGEQSFWYPFVNYLPKRIDTLYTLPDD